MKKGSMMRAMSVQEKKEVNGGSLNAPSVIHIIYNALRGIFIPMA